MAVRFTQFLRPDGQRIPVTIALPEAVEKKARQINNAGYRFEIEVLSDEITVHATISNDKGDHASCLVPNGTKVPDAIAKMILNFKL